MDELIKAMTSEQLLAIKEQHPDNPSVISLVDGILVAREKEAGQVQLAKDFEAKVAKLAKLPPPPEHIHNLFLKWAKVEVEDTSQEPEMVDITNPDTQEVTQEPRYPKTDVWQWVVETNKVSTVTTKGTGGGGNGVRSIIVKQEVNNQLTVIGEYASARVACDAIKQGKEARWVTDDSGTRELNKNGYLVYDKTTGAFKR